MKFNKDLTQALIKANIPISKVNHPAFKLFLEKHMSRSLPDESTLRKNYISAIYDERIQKIKEIIGDNDIFLIVDQATDCKKRAVLNILVGPLNGRAIEPMLIKVTYLENDKQNDLSICKQCLHRFY